MAASHSTDEMRFIITYPVFVLVKNTIKGHALWSSFFALFGLASKHAWDTNCFSIVSEAATAYVFWPFKRFKLHYLFILQSYNMRWECCIILVFFFGLLTLNPFWRQRGEVIKLRQGDSVGLVVLKLWNLELL